MKFREKEITMENLMEQYKKMIEKYSYIFIAIRYEKDGYVYREDITDIQFISLYFEKILKEEPIEIGFFGLKF